ncbi:MAG: aminodeoxychorismate/anthranilate synthase component II [Myxococcales bacterium]|nr:aminodeoxychorismate/anthranilate synthase component II [Myxococcales bacterium]
MHLVLVDAYDSFTHNLVHALAPHVRTVTVVRCDEVQPTELLDADLVVLGPGPGTPEETGCFLDAARLLVARRPLLGVCLGHQALAEALGGTLRIHGPVHGHATSVKHDGTGLFQGLPSPLSMTRYHSIVVDRVPSELRVCAHGTDGTIQGISHRQAPAWGVQFHPESVLSGSNGQQLLARFAQLGRTWLGAARAVPASEGGGVRSIR